MQSSPMPMASLNDQQPGLSQSPASPGLLQMKDSEKLTFLVEKMSIIDTLVMKIGDLEERVKQLETSCMCKQVERDPYDPEVTIVANGIRPSADEDVVAKAQEIIRDGLQMNDATVVRATRLIARGTKHGLVKIEFPDLQTKIDALRRKQQLQDYNRHGRIYIRGAQTHVEHLIDSNFKTLLNELQNGRNYRITGNGKVIRRDANRPPPNDGGGGPALTAPAAGQTGTQAQQTRGSRLPRGNDRR